MDKNIFLKKFFEIYGGFKNDNSPDSYDYIDFEVMITTDSSVEKIAVFTGENSIFPIILQVPSSKHYLEFGFANIFLVEGKQVRRGQKQKKLLNLIVKYLEDENLIEKVRF